MYYQVPASVGFASNGEGGNGRGEKKASNDKISSKLKKKKGWRGGRPCHMFFKVRKMEIEMQRESA